MASGEAEVAIHQISEIVPVKGAVLVGPLPAEVQNFTTYSAGLGAAAKDAAAAKALIAIPRRPSLRPDPEDEGHGKALRRRAACFRNLTMKSGTARGNLSPLPPTPLSCARRLQRRDVAL